MTVARWLRAALAVQVVVLLLWLGGWARCGAAAAWAALACVPLLARLPLALQFALAARRGRAGPGPHPPVRQWLRAWWAEGLWAGRVFGWWQPFRSGAIADALPGPGAGRGRGMVLVHGFGCNRGFWTQWLRRLRAEGRAFVAVTLEPPLASIDDHAGAIDAAVRRVRAATGLAPLIVAHSMGGLAVRAWLRAVPDAEAHRIVTLATPHQGAWTARFAWGAGGRQMEPGSRWLQALAAAEPPERRARFVCWLSDCDNVVYPRGAAVLPGAQVHGLAGLGHVEMAFDERVMGACFGFLEG